MTEIIDKPRSVAKLGFFSRILNIFRAPGQDLCTLEEKLLNADFDYELVEKLLDNIKLQKLNDEEAINFVKKTIAEIFQQNCAKFDIEKYHAEKLAIMFVGINGAGKTTTIAKIAAMYSQKKPLLVACDNFRAAAVEQLAEWNNKLNFEIFTAGTERNPAAIAYKAAQNYMNGDSNLMLIDTSGRLHNNINLMNELQKIEKTLKKCNTNFPQEVFLVLDGTMGQSLLNQIESFSKYINITGLIITKLDGVSRGGIMVSIMNKFRIPIYFIGIGESQDSIKPFDASEFIQTLMN